MYYSSSNSSVCKPITSTISLIHISTVTPFFVGYLWPFIYPVQHKPPLFSWQNDRLFLFTLSVHTVNATDSPLALLSDSPINSYAEHAFTKWLIPWLIQLYLHYRSCKLLLILTALYIFDYSKMLHTCWCSICYWTHKMHNNLMFFLTSYIYSNICLTSFQIDERSLTINLLLDLQMIFVFTYFNSKSCCSSLLT